MTLAVFTVNAAIRWVGGGGPSYLSVFHMKDKLRALEHLWAHIPRHFRDDTCDGDPSRALRAAARRHGVPVSLALAMARTESNLRPHAISHAGAMGLLQLMPDTAVHMKVADPFDPTQSANGGMKYMAWLLKRYKGDRRRAVAAYNAGPYAVPKTGPMKLPGETRIYVKKVLARERAALGSTSRAPRAPPARAP